MLTDKKAEFNLGIRSDHSFVKFFTRLHKGRKGTQNSKDIWSIEEMIVQWMLNSIFLELACFEASLPCLELEYQKVPRGTFPQIKKPAQPVMTTTKSNDFLKGECFPEVGKSKQLMGYFPVIICGIGIFLGATGLYFMRKNWWLCTT